MGLIYYFFISKKKKNDKEDGSSAAWSCLQLHLCFLLGFKHFKFVLLLRVKLCGGRVIEERQGLRNKVHQSFIARNSSESLGRWFAPDYCLGEVG